MPKKLNTSIKFKRCLIHQSVISVLFDVIIKVNNAYITHFLVHGAESG